MLHKNTSCLVALVAALTACSSGDPVDIGDDPVAKTGEKLSDYAATWQGYAEAYAFDSGSDAIRIVLDENGEGTLEIGNASPLPTATDPEVGYPPGAAFGPGTLSVLPVGRLYSGFAFTIQGAIVANRRLQLEVVPTEVFAAWCALQTPVLDEVNSTDEHQSYYCVNNWGGGGNAEGCYEKDPDTGERQPIDCGKRALCLVGRACACTADGCSNSQGATATLDAALESEGDELEGTLAVGEQVTVRMTRN
jgi:hypothetical protein